MLDAEYEATQPYDERRNEQRNQITNTQCDVA